MCRFLTDLPKGLDTFNDICMAQQADSSVLEDNKKHVASIVQVHSILRPHGFCRKLMKMSTLLCWGTGDLQYRMGVSCLQGGAIHKCCFGKLG